MTVNPCASRLNGYNPGDAILLEPHNDELGKFYKKVLGFDLPDIEHPRPMVAHFLGWARKPYDPFNPHRDDPADAFIVRVVLPFGPTIAVSCCQVKRKLSSTEMLALLDSTDDVKAVLADVSRPSLIKRVRSYVDQTKNRWRKSYYRFVRSL